MTKSPAVVRVDRHLTVLVPRGVRLTDCLSADTADIRLRPAETWKLHTAAAERNFLIRIIKTSSPFFFFLLLYLDILGGAGQRGPP